MGGGVEVLGWGVEGWGFSESVRIRLSGASGVRPLLKQSPLKESLTVNGLAERCVAILAREISEIRGKWWRLAGLYPNRRRAFRIRRLSLEASGDGPRALALGRRRLRGTLASHAKPSERNVDG